MAQKPQPFPRPEAAFVESETLSLAPVWYYFLFWIYQQLGGATGASASGLFVDPPLHSNSDGLPGQIAYDASFLYVCLAPSSWARVAIGGAW